jgi:hypothetical protein
MKGAKKVGKTGDKKVRKLKAQTLILFLGIG